MAQTKAKETARGESLLVELLTEELPPKSLRSLAQALASELTEALRAEHFLTESSEAETFATPRRLAVRISGVVARQPDRMIERKGPSVQAGLDASGGPTPALAGFARSCGVAPDRLERRKDEKGEHFVYRAKRKGEPLAQHLAGLVDRSIRKLPAARSMRWAARDVQFVRPVHGLVMLHGNKVVRGEIMGLKSGNKTRGHRFMSKGPIAIKRARDYERTLRVQGKIVVSFDVRRDMIVRELDKAAAKLGKRVSWHLGKDMELVEEVTSIVESPSVHMGAFDPAFLEVPRECLIVSMQYHLKHFALANASGELQPRFLFVANMQPRDPREIVHGNERVLRARLADAKFFYNQDRKERLENRVPRLAHVVYHNKLGSQRDRIDRIKRLAGDIARRLGADNVLAERAAELCKADLLTNMVGEFPELQGIMGRYYALHDGEPREVADAIEQHYRPRFAGDALPEGAIACSVALGDKLDTLASMFGVGEQPSGDKDPFGLRRAALGVLRILIEKSLRLDLMELLSQAVAPSAHSADVAMKLYGFFKDRLIPYLRERYYAPDEIDAVLAVNPVRLDQVIARLNAVKTFRSLPEGMALAAANKRTRNILRQAETANIQVHIGSGGHIELRRESNTGIQLNRDLLREAAERRLGDELASASAELKPMVDSGDYGAALRRLAALRPAVDEFFDKVMVMADNEVARENRLALLTGLANLFLNVGDISRLQS